MTSILAGQFDFSSQNYLANYFIIEESKQRQIAKIEVVLPEGYEFADLDPEVSSWTISKYSVILGIGIL